MAKNKKILKIWNSIYNDYCDQILIHPISKDGEFYSYIKSKQIIVPANCFKNPDSWDVFAFLHEIGHVLTNTDKMKRCTQEYLATQWAIEKAKEIGFAISKSSILCYQDYIWKWREKSIKLRGKNIPSKEDLTLVY